MGLGDDQLERDSGAQSGVPASSDRDLMHTAVRLLAMREHSQKELVTKLTKRGWPESAVIACVERLSDDGLQSDQRYAEGLIRSRVSKGYGPLRVRMELAERGVERAVVEATLQAAAVDWLAVASDWYARRYGETPIIDLKERSRRHQALPRRGFDASIGRELLD